MSVRRLGSQLGQLALALLNATLLLAVLLVFGLWLLLDRAQDFAADTARAAAAAIGVAAGDRLEDGTASLNLALANLKAMDGRLSEVVSRAGTADGPTARELAGLRADVQALTGAVAGLNDTATAISAQSYTAVSDVLRQVLVSLSAKLAPTSAPALPEN